MNSLGKGDYVECIEGHDSPVLVVGALYIVDEVVVDDGYECLLHRSPDCFGLRTLSPALPKHIYWCGKRFRPILKYRDGQFDYMASKLFCEDLEDA